MHGFIIRKYQSSDHKEVVKLHESALKNIGAYINNGWDKDLDDIKKNYFDNYGDFLIGTFNGKIIAMGALRKLTAEVAEIKRMRVNPEFQRRGFGRLMLKALEKRAIELGYNEIQLDTTTQETGQYLYRNQGFTEFKREKDGSAIEKLFFRKKLIEK